MAYCEQCGAKNIDGAAVCAECGAALSPTAVSSADYGSPGSYSQPPSGGYSALGGGHGAPANSYGAAPSGGYPVPGHGIPQQNYGQQPYSQSYSGYTPPPPPYAASPYAPASDPVTIGDWVVTYLLQMIPLVGIILMFVWAFDSSTKPSKKNWARASLILAGVVLGLYIIAIIIGFGALASSGIFD
ncbi:MAG: zinc-ribbon domain-containing protein [Clostridiales bacterium]|jgi:hypothetical protein|nr:zinc-ribbon domain-containing protein [Clostridiales bacterium]